MAKGKEDALIKAEKINAEIIAEAAETAKVRAKEYAEEQEKARQHEVLEKEKARLRKE